MGNFLVANCSEDIINICSTDHKLLSGIGAYQMRFPLQPNDGLQNKTENLKKTERERTKLVAKTR
jgi:hypothetical protein